MKEIIVNVLKKNIWLIIIMVASFFIRCSHLSRESIYGDEAYSIYHAQHSLQETIPFFLYDQNPPLHIVLLHFWVKLFGVTDVAAKSFSIFCSILAGGFLFIFLNKRTNKTIAILASFLFLFSNAQQFYANEARMYALVEVLIVLSVIAYFRLMQDPPKVIWVVLLLVFNLALLFTHYLTIYLFIVQFLTSFLFFKTNRRGVYAYFISQILAALAFFPWLKILIYNIPKSGSFWNTIPGYEELRWHMGILLGGDLLLYLFLTLFIISIVLFLRRALRKKSSSFDVRLFVFFALLFVLPVLLNFIVSQYTPVFLSRYILYCTIGLFICIACMLSEIALNPVVKTPVMIAVVILVVASFSLIQKREDNWKGLVEALKKEKVEDPFIFVSASYKIKEFSFYYDHAAFCDYKNTDERLFNKHIYYFDKENSARWSTLDLSQTKNIIYVQSHSQFEDPEEKIKQMILDNCFVEDHFEQKGNARYTVFRADKQSNP